MKITAILVFLLVFLAGCQPIIKKLYGIKDPDVENEKSIKKKHLNMILTVQILSR